jgi:peptide/nickel transport system ATP-binding protein
MSLLEVRDLKKYFSVRNTLFSRDTGHLKAVDGVSFSVDSGETFGLVGESGCGKSTLARTILRLIEPTSGEVQFSGEDLLRLSSAEMRRMRRRIQMIFQDPYGSLDPRMKIQDTIAEPLVIHKIGDRKERQQKVSELMGLVGLDPVYRSRYPHEFSGGQRQRIGIARALALQPELIVADEPVSALDVSVQGQIINLLKELQERLRLTFLLIAHDLAVVQHFCDRIAVMYLGKIVEMAPSLKLFSKPQHPYTRILLQSVPKPDPSARRALQGLSGEIPSALNPPAGCSFHPRCPIAVDRCRIETPELRQISENHLAACHLIDG